MSKLLLKARAPDPDGLVHRVTPASAGWGHVGFELYRLAPGQELAAETRDGERFSGLGERMGPFEGKPYSVYVPWRSGWRVQAETDLELAVCRAPGGGDHRARRIGPDRVASSVRGKSTNTRHVQDILPETEPAHSLLVVEVITPSGCWSSYPSHKHDTDNLPEESLLEETYYHRLDPPQGFAFQRVYTDDGALDETMCIHDGDVTLVPRGYHPCGTAHGYDLYYLNVMAGPKRVWRFNTEPAHRWLLEP
jgi:5-deoxy-glucuronate isomerase